MSAPWTVAALLALLLVVVLVVGAALTRSARRRADVRASLARAEADALRARLEHLESRVAATERTPRRVPGHADGDLRRDDAAEHVITVLGRDDVGGHDDRTDHDEVPAAVPATLPASLFADLVLREGVVQVAALAAGVRRALAPEQRHRVRLEMRREVKRARKQRRTEVREARRALADRQRSAA